MNVSLNSQSVVRLFIRYLIPSMIGMMLMAANVVIDGIMVGSRLGAEALAGVGIASPVYTIFFAISLWIGIGAATRYSIAMGAAETKQARAIFTQALVLVFSITIFIAVAAYSFREPLVYALGANKETYPYASEYMTVMLLFGFVFTIESVFSVFVRNDGGPNLAMTALVTMALANIILNYVFLFKLNWGVSGAALATVISCGLAILVLSAHFFSRFSNLKLVRFAFEKKLIWIIIAVGFPSFIAEIGMSVFTVSHNVLLEKMAGTDGVAAFSILNYVHSVMLMLFFGMGSAIQPLISYYHGALNEIRKKETLRLALFVAAGAGFLFFIIGQAAAGPIVSVFGDFSPSVTALAIDAIGLFFIGYLFMGINFIMMTYYQSIGRVRMAVWITLARQIVIMLLLLAVLPSLFGLAGVWLTIPVSELIVLLTIIQYERKGRFKRVNQNQKQLNA
ncbi:MATE family efflux transporter [Domibacillus enclensis]|uniref:Multidrug export protein MepA n=1 Tax=Domibacillus enclensis TaxID=1017273 RepID=A0A1N6NWB3_9BACI|nr:MATE family efflux transporter [Domibacillus enclensis]OXS80166.1 MATE family efflux transporter [Domibacillus enclensis]SIP96418.1 putative efflux protein, MATE family [Domibacillus enclensis]